MKKHPTNKGERIQLAKADRMKVKPKTVHPRGSSHKLRMETRMALTNAVFVFDELDMEVCRG